MSVTNNKKGFTLIELVIVLAIGALVIAGVILAIGGAQQNRRDSQRKDDLGKIVAKLENFASNNNGCYPGSAGLNGCPAGVQGFVGFTGAYLNNPQLTDPSSGAQYTYANTAANPAAVAAGGTANVNYIYGQNCNGAAAGRVYAIRIGQENGQVCRSNQ